NLLPIVTVLEIFRHKPHQVHTGDPTHNIRVQNDYFVLLICPSFPSLVADLSTYTSYCFVMGANLASNRLMPVGAGTAMSNSISSPSPFTFTTVPTPHFLCTALSPAFHTAFSAPDVIFLSIAIFLSSFFFSVVI